LTEKQKNAIKAIEPLIDSSIQTKDEKKRMRQLKQALKLVRRLIPANQWGENSLVRFMEHPQGKARLSKSNFGLYNRIHLRRDQKQLMEAGEKK
jgi:hypothetical protein